MTKIFRGSPKPPRELAAAARPGRKRSHAEVDQKVDSYPSKREGDLPPYPERAADARDFKRVVLSPKDSNGVTHGAPYAPRPFLKKFARIAGPETQKVTPSRQPFTPGFRKPVARTLANAWAYDWLVSLGQGDPPMYLVSSQQKFIIVDTGIKGGFGGFHIGVDSRGALWGIKQMVSADEVVLSESLGLDLGVHPTALHEAEHEVSMMRAFSPGLMAQPLIRALDARLYIPMKFMVSSVSHALTKTPPAYRTAAALYLFRGAAEKFEFLHRHDHVHGDVKLENIFVGTDGVVEMADLGMAMPAPNLGTLSGTYASFEMIARKEVWGAPTDVQALCASFVHSFAGDASHSPFANAGFEPQDVHAMQKTLEEFRVFRVLELQDRRIPTHLAYFAAHFANLKRELPTVHRFVLEFGMHPDPKCRATMSQLKSALSDLQFSEESFARAKTSLLSTLRLPRHVSEMSEALVSLFWSREGR